MKDQIKQKLSSLPTAELQKIYAEHDLTEWSEDAFVAIHEILRSRGEEVPELAPRDEKAATALKRSAASSAQDNGSIISGLSIIVFLLLSAVSVYAANGVSSAAIVGILMAGASAAVLFGIGAILKTLGVALEVMNGIRDLLEQRQNTGETTNAEQGGDGDA